MALSDSELIDVGQATNVLFLAPTMHAAIEPGCGSLLATAGPSHNALLSILTIERPEDLLRTWHEHAHDEPPERSAFVLLGGGGNGQPGGPFEDGDRVIHPIRHPSNLTDLGVATSTYLSRWYDEERSIACCFRSITMLLQYVPKDVVYRFLHQFAQHITAVGGVAHYHMDPTAHEPHEVNTLVTLFDAVAELDEDGEWQVRSRALG